MKKIGVQDLPRSERMQTFNMVIYCMKRLELYEHGRANYLFSEEAAMDPANIDIWSCIKWKHVEKRVNELQSRITKAVMRKKYHLVTRLQHLLKNSFLAKLIAVRKVTTNKGKHTSGIDRKLWTTPKRKWKAALTLESRGYRSLPLRRKYIEKKGKKKKRPLGIPTMYDRAMQALYALTLDPMAEAKADQRSFGFRKYRGCQDAGQQIFITLSGKTKAEWILEGDIKGCFDNISHKWLLENIPMEKKVLKEFLKSGYVYDRKLFPTKEGSPQGGIISPVLANMTLDGIEMMLKKRYSSSSTGKIDRQHNKEKVNFIRYADDFIVTAKSRETAEKAQEMIKDFISQRGLELSEEKTIITHIDEGFDFLGWNVRKYGGRLMIKPSNDSCKGITSNVRALIKKSTTVSQDTLIKALNPKILGWCNYHKSMVSKQKFQQLDAVIFKALWKWARSRHPRKSRQWIKDRYWKKIGKRDWIFMSENQRLVFASSIKIKRHTMTKLEKNPYLKEDEQYFKNRNSVLCYS